MNLRLVCTILFTVAFLGLSCNSEEKKQRTEGDSSFIKKDSLSYTIRHVKNFSPYFSEVDGQLDSTYFEANFPIFDEDINELVKEAVFINGEENIEQVSENFLSAFNEFAEDVMDSGTASYGSWFLAQNCRVVLNTGDFLTLAHSISEYTGGAHGLEVELWYNYDLRQHKKLELLDIIQDSTQFRALVEQHFRKHENLSDTSSYHGAYFFEKNDFVLADNFGFNQQGLIFHYNVYEIKAYSEGPTTLLIPYAELDGFLTETGNLLRNSIESKK